MKWRTSTFFKPDDPYWVEYHPVPEGRTDCMARDNEQYDVCVLASGFCACSLVNGFKKGSIKVPDKISNVDIWSETDLDEYDSLDGRTLRRKFYNDYFPGVLLDKMSSRNEVRYLKIFVLFV